MMAVSPSATTEESVFRSEKSFFTINDLPIELLSVILHHASITEGQKTVKNRLVCKLWKSAFDGNVQIISKLCFGIQDVNEIFASEISSRIRSISLGDKSVDDFGGVEELLRKICENIVDIRFKFSNLTSLTIQQRLFSLVIKHCTKLKYLKVDSRERRFLRYLTEEEIKCVGSNIRHVMINMTLLDDSDLQPIEGFLLSLSALSSVNFSCEDGHDQILHWLREAHLPPIIHKHLEAFHGSLKMVTFSSSSPAGSELLLESCMRHNLEVDFGQMEFNITATIIQPEADLVFNPERCRSVKRGRIYLHDGHDEYQTTTGNILTQTVQQRIVCFTNIQYLDLSLWRYVSEGELDFLHNLSHLNELYIEKQCELGMLEPRAFLSGQVNASILGIDGDVFLDPEMSFKTLPYGFPQLHELNLENIKQLPEMTIRCLSPLTSLQTLNLHYCGIDDKAFTMEVPTFGLVSSCPAIAALPNLRNVTLEHCEQLTGIFLTHGMAYCSGLACLSILTNSKSLLAEECSRFSLTWGRMNATVERTDREEIFRYRSKKDKLRVEA